MLREYSKIIRPIRALKTDRIAVWRGEGKDKFYVKRIFVD
jgi:hypothetical protein